MVSKPEQDALIGTNVCLLFYNKCVLVERRGIPCTSLPVIERNMQVLLICDISGGRVFQLINARGWIG